MTIAIIDNGIVVTIDKAHSLDFVGSHNPTMLVVESDSAKIGDSYANGVFTPAIIVIEQLRRVKNIDIDMHTQYLISQGVEFDGSVFSLSSNAQTYWTALRANKDFISFPISVSTKDDGEYILTNENFDAFIAALFGSVMSHLSSGRALKQLVNASSTPQDIVDNRE